MAHAAFSGTIEPSRLSAAYRFGLVVVAIAMLLLPALYLALIGFAGTAVWWHVTGNTWLLGRGVSQWRLFMYAAPAVIGIVLVFFMVKPILARPAKRRDPVPIDPEAEPALFAFIHEICRLVRAPVPRRVQVDCQVNASASFMPGRFSMLRRDLVLTIGLPLAAGLSVRELGGVLAHEFGHFAQGGGMRLTALVRGVNAWFARVVYERDEWDETLEYWSKESDWRLSIVLLLARGAVRASRWVLTVLMMGGHAISCFMLRQMEYDADSYEIKVAGSEAFARTSAHMRQMSVAAQVGYADLAEALRGRMLPSNLPSFVVQRRDHLPGELLDQIQRMNDRPTRWFDTHPSDADRIRAAEAAAASGVLADERPAAQLFRNFEALSAAATRHHYEHDLGLGLECVRFVESEAVLRHSKGREESHQALEQFFGASASVYRPLRLQTEAVEPLSVAQLRSKLDSARQVMSAAGERLAERYRHFEALDTTRTKGFAAEELLCAGFTIANAAEFDLAEATIAGAKATQDRALEEQRHVAAELEAFEAAAVRRLSCGVRLAAYATQPEEVASLASAFNALVAVIPHVHDLRRLQIAAEIVEHGAAAGTQPDRTNARTRHLAALIGSCRDRIRNGLREVACPAVFAAEPMTLAVRCGVPPGGEPERPSEIVDRVLGLYGEMLGRLVAIALDAESGRSREAGGEMVAAAL